MIKEHFVKISNGECSKTELTLTGICLVLIGVVIGMIIAPARFFVAGSFNGNQGSLHDDRLVGPACHGICRILHHHVRKFPLADGNGIGNRSCAGYQKEDI